MKDDEIVSQLENLRDIIGDRSTSKENTDAPSMERSSADNRYVNVYSSPQYYWERCFPNLYPYGRGGPSDPSFAIRKMSEYHAHVLLRGGGKNGRRFQNCASHIFATYTYDLKRRVGNMSYAATRGDSSNTDEVLTSKAVVGTLLECIANSTEDEPLEIETLYARAQAKQSDQGVGLETVVNDATVLSRVNDLLKRIVPYANHAPGTPMYMSFARKNLLAMVTAPVITIDACWRWFATFAYADMYESRVFEIVLDAVLDYADREDVVSGYNKKTRSRILRTHPALVARVFHEKQDALWTYVLYGSDKPLGDILDHMR